MCAMCMFRAKYSKSSLLYRNRNSDTGCALDRFTKELFLNFGGSRPFLMEDFIALPNPPKNFVQMLPLPLVLALVFFTRVGSSWRRQKTTCGSIVCHYMNVSHLFCTNNILITPTHSLSALQAPLIPLGYLWYPPRQVAAVMQVES